MKLFFFDTETTGLNSDDQILQFGGIFGTFDGKIFHEERRISQFINVTKEISPDAERVHGINKDKVKNFGYIENYIDEILLYIRKADYIIGHNLDFDVKILKQDCKRIGKEFDWESIKSFCTMKESIDIVNLPGKNRPKLSELYYSLFNRYFDNAHDAMADIEATKDCFIELVKRGKMLNKNIILNNSKEFDNIELENALVSVAENGDEGTVRLLLQAGVSPGAYSYDRSMEATGPSALMVAASNGHLQIVKLLIRLGANINHHNSEDCGKRGNTALIEASGNGHKEIVELLINGGADINHKNEYGNTALIEASKNGHKEIVELLINGGADINIYNYKGKTALMTAKNSAIEEVLEENGALNNIGDTTDL